MSMGRYFGRISFAALVAFATLIYGPSMAAPEKDDGWRAIVAFTDTEAVSEDWNWFLQDIRNAVDRAEAAEGVEIQVIYAGPGVKTVVIGPRDTPLARIDIGRYREHGKGYLFIENERRIDFHPYGQSADTLRAASEYFGVGLGP